VFDELVSRRAADWRATLTLGPSPGGRRDKKGTCASHLFPSPSGREVRGEGHLRTRRADSTWAAFENTVSVPRGPTQTDSDDLILVLFNAKRKKLPWLKRRLNNF
jgi:hypothetical protein